VDEAQQRLIHNIVMSMKDVAHKIQARQIQRFFKADQRYGRGIAEGRGFDPKTVLDLSFTTCQPTNPRQLRSI
jgi:catalase